ncbi:MAG: T9SS type A sorting domain-containing protein [Bacteroidales bacterium]|nr:T9SS type A sorting domain-containing protein [Bacteroidales bacterium]
MKRFLIIAMSFALAQSAAAQRFEWAKGYTVESNNYRSIVGGVTDSLGNLYILGNCDATSVWDGTEDIIPSIHKSTKNLLNDILIAKISPEGEMVWKKVIFGNNGNSCIAHDIKKIGDTAFACLVEIGLPEGLTDYCYYLDTFMVGYSDYPIPLSAETTSMTRFTALITFNFSGEVIEQHFLQVSYIDSAGNDCRIGSSQLIMNQFLWTPSFDIDGDGNIYITRTTTVDDMNGYLSVQDGSSIGLKFWVDQRCVGSVYVNDGYHSGREPQILKFSPHFDTLLGCRYVIQKWNSNNVTPLKTTTKVDLYGNVYIIPLYRTRIADTIVIDSLLHKELVNDVGYLTFLVSYNTDLNTRWVIKYDDNIIDETTRFGLFKAFNDIDFDYDSNLFFLSASTLRSFFDDTVNYLSTLSYRGVQLPIKDGVSVASFYNTDTTPVMHSYGVFPGIKVSVNDPLVTRGNLFCKNNRVFVQSQYRSGIDFPSQATRLSSIADCGLALTVFDYSGRVIDGIDYGIESRTNNYPGPIVLHDSVLYLCNLLKTSAQFGDISFPVYGETNVIAKYVDTAFMHLYVRPTLGISTAAAVAPRVYPVPATDRLHFDCPAGSVPTAVAAISLSGWRMPLTATASSADVSCLAPGVYLLEITTPKDKYYTKFVKR